MEVKLRSWSMTDLKDLVRFANNPKIAQFMTDQFAYPYTEEKGRSFIEMTLTHKPTQIMAIEVDGVAVGGIGIHPESDIRRLNAELGYWLAEDYWGQGIVSLAIRQMVRYAFSTFDIDRIYAIPFENNLASQRVLEKNGFNLDFRLEKTLIKNGVKLDEMIYSVRRK